MPEDISELYDVDLAEQLRILEDFERKKHRIYAPPKKQNKIIKALGQLVTDVIVPGFVTYKQ